MPSTIDQHPNLRPTSRQFWRSWLRRHHATSSGIWVVYSKRSAGRQPLSYDAAVEEALCYGWIDSLVRSIDERSYRQLYTPRKPRSPWSALNKRRAAAMIKAGKMTEAGMARIREAKRNGTWAALSKVDRLVMPSDLSEALRQNPRARACYRSWSASTKRGILWWLHSAKRPETRAKRLRDIVNSATRGTKPSPYQSAK
jgi:uncharacterized protein YdeI (YjbR/CyaY-like superfamily)